MCCGSVGRSAVCACHDVVEELNNLASCTCVLYLERGGGAYPSQRCSDPRSSERT